MVAEILAFLVTLPVMARDRWELPEDRGIRLEAAAQDIARAARGNYLLAAAVSVQGARESLFSVGWGACHCLGVECDRGRAHGYWQWHHLPSETAEDWEALCVLSESTAIAAARTAKWLRGCADGDVGCLAGKFAMLGGLPAADPPPWAVQRAKDSIGLAVQIKKKERTRKKRLLA